MLNYRTVGSKKESESNEYFFRNKQKRKAIRFVAKPLAYKRYITTLLAPQVYYSCLLSGTLLGGGKGETNVPYDPEKGHNSTCNNRREPEVFFTGHLLSIFVVALLYLIDC